MRKRCQCQTILRVKIVGKNDCLVAGNAGGKELRSYTVVGCLIAISAGKAMNLNIPMTRESRPPRIGVINYTASVIKIT